MKKSLKIISFFLLSILLLQNINTVYADCNVKNVVEKTLSNGQKIKQVFITHDELVKSVEDEKANNDMAKWICSVVGTCKLGWVSGLAKGIGLMLSAPFGKTKAQQWKETSSGCGIIVTYLYQHHVGGIYTGGGQVTKDEYVWDEVKVEPQK